MTPLTLAIMVAVPIALIAAFYLNRAVVKTFNVYQHPAKGYQAVKQGFCWPAFFVTWVWALLKKMWIHAFALFCIASFIWIFQTSYLPFIERAYIKSEWGGRLVEIALNGGVATVVGFYANGWRTANLLRRGFSHIVVVQARTPEAAIATVESIDYSKSTNAEKAASRKTRTGRMDIKRGAFLLWAVLSSIWALLVSVYLLVSAVAIAEMSALEIFVSLLFQPITIIPIVVLGVLVSLFVGIILVIRKFTGR